MKRITMILTALMISTSTFAIDSRDVSAAGFDKLSETQKAHIIGQVEQTAGNKGDQLVKDVDQWVNLGEKVGKMMGGAAKELGVAANEFSVTPLGKITMGLIVWKFMGGALIHVFGGLLILTIGFSWLFLMVRRITPVTIEYDVSKKDILGRSVKKKVSLEALDDETSFGFIVAGGAVIVVSLIAMFTF